MQSENPPAFPQALNPDGPFGGMTLRDWFAGRLRTAWRLIAGPQEWVSAPVILPNAHTELPTPCLPSATGGPTHER